MAGLSEADLLVVQAYKEKLTAISQHLCSVMMRAPDGDDKDHLKIVVIELNEIDKRMVHFT